MKENRLSGTKKIRKKYSPQNNKTVGLESLWNMTSKEDLNGSEQFCRAETLEVLHKAEADWLIRHIDQNG